MCLTAMATSSPVPGEVSPKGRIRKVKVAKTKDGSSVKKDGDGGSKLGRIDGIEKLAKLGNLEDWGWFFNVNNPLRVHVDTMEVWDR